MVVERTESFKAVSLRSIQQAESSDLTDERNDSAVGFVKDRHMAKRDMKPRARVWERYETKCRWADERRSEANERFPGANLLGTPIDERCSIEGDRGWVVRPATTRSIGTRGGGAC